MEGEHGAMIGASKDVAIALADSDADIAASLPVMQGLHPQWTDTSGYLSQIRKQMAGGYHLALLRWRGEAAGCAGYRFLDMLTRGHFMHVDDLVTAAEHRSLGLGQTLFQWLVDAALKNNCTRIDLGTSR